VFILSSKNRDDLNYWIDFTQQTKDIFTWKKIVAIITIIAIMVQIVGMTIEPSNWLIWNLLTFIVATNLGAVVLAIIAQKTADDIKKLYQTAFDADFYHSLHLLSVVKNSMSDAAKKDDSDLVSKIDEMSPQIYVLIKGYLETFEQHYYETKDDGDDDESKTVKYDDVEELFN
jgi:hypothetical protein